MASILGAELRLVEERLSALGASQPLGPNEMPISRVREADAQLLTMQARVTSPRPPVPPPSILVTSQTPAPSPLPPW